MGMSKVSRGLYESYERVEGEGQALFGWNANIIDLTRSSQHKRRSDQIPAIKTAEAVFLIYNTFISTTCAVPKTYCISPAEANPYAIYDPLLILLKQLSSH